MEHRYVALHTADPGDDGTATTNETSYTGYARVPLDWEPFADDEVAFNPEEILFPVCGVTGAALTHASIVTTASGAGQILYSVDLREPLAVFFGVAPLFHPKSLTLRHDDE